MIDLRRRLRRGRSQAEPAKPPAPAAPRRPRAQAPVGLFVVTYGRSGSTLVQGILNALPRTLVRGENGFFVLDLFRGTERAVGFAERHLAHGARNTRTAFFGVHGIHRRVFVKHLRRLVRSVLLAEHSLAEVDRLGFKEVLWYEITPEETEPFFTWLERLFPDARYVLHTRDRASLPSSGFWRFEEPEAVFAKVDRVVEIQEHLARTRPDRVLATSYERLADPDARDVELRALATFATGHCDEDTLVTLRAILDTRHGPWGRPGEVPPDAARYGGGHG